MELKNAAIVIADISGYTQFIKFHKDSLLHAEEVITELLETVVQQATYPLKFNKLEGDAVLLFAETNGNAAAACQDVARQAQAFFQTFHAKAGELGQKRADCPCMACQNIAGLRLKTLLHFGEVAVKQFHQFEEIGGEAVILIHRLLKNQVAADEYLLLTETFHQLSGDLPAVRVQRLEETYPDLGRVGIVVFYPQT